MEIAAFVLRRIPTGESDLVVSLLTREKGRIDVFARAARRSRKRFQGGFAPCIQYRGRVRPSSRTSLWTLDELEIAENYPTLVTSVPRMVTGQYATELVREFCPMEAPVPELFDWMATFMTRLNWVDTPSWRDWYLFEMGVFRFAGIIPQIDACVQCRRTDVSSGWAFSFTQGGIVCPLCSPSMAGMLPWNPVWTHIVRKEQQTLPDAPLVMKLLERWLEFHGIRLQARRLCFDIFSRPTGW